MATLHNRLIQLLLHTQTEDEREELTRAIGRAWHIFGPLLDISLPCVQWLLGSAGSVCVELVGRGSGVGVNGAGMTGVGHLHIDEGQVHNTY